LTTAGVAVCGQRREGVDMALAVDVVVVEVAEVEVAVAVAAVVAGLTV